MIHIAFDIETVALPVPQAALDAERARLSEEYVKESTIENHLQKFVRSYGFRPEGCRPVAIAFSYVNKQGQVVDTEGVQSDDPLTCAKMFMDVIDEYASPKLVGYNLLAFDLPVICRYAFELDRHLEDENLLGRYDVIDLIQAPFGNRFNQRGGFKRLCAAYGVETCGIDGSMVAGMYEKDLANDTQDVLKYCIDDARACGELFSKFSRIFSFGK